jgi:hypothetical protein
MTVRAAVDPALIIMIWATSYHLLYLPLLLLDDDKQ